MKNAIIILSLILVFGFSPVSARGLPEDFVSFYDVCREQVNTCGKELPDKKINLILTWRNDTSYIVSLGNNNPENISGVYDVEVKLRSDFNNIEIIALGEDVISPKKAENGMVVFDYPKEIIAGGYGKAFITLNAEETGSPKTTASTTEPPKIANPTITSSAVATTPPAMTAPPEQAKEPFWKSLQGLILVLVFSIIITIVMIKSGALDPPEQA